MDNQELPLGKPWAVSTAEAAMGDQFQCSLHNDSDTGREMFCWDMKTWPLVADS